MIGIVPSTTHTCFLCLLDLEDFRRRLLSSEEEEDGGLLPRSRFPISSGSGGFATPSGP